MKKSLQWFNSLGQTRRNELALDYYGTDILTDEDIEAIFLAEYRYYIEFVGKKFLSVFPAPEQNNNKEHKTLEEALNYMIEEHKIKEITIKN